MIINFLILFINILLNSESFATILIGMSEVLTTVWTETQNYPLSAVISDIGGAAGLFLGLGSENRPFFIFLKLPMTNLFQKLLIFPGYLTQQGIFFQPYLGLNVIGVLASVRSAISRVTRFIKRKRAPKIGGISLLYEKDITGYR